MLSFSSPLGSGKLIIARPQVPHPHHAAMVIRTPSEILPRLWLSGLYTAVDEEKLIALGVTHIVSILEQRPKYPRTLTKLKTLHIPLQDLDGADILQHLDTTTAFIKSALEDSKRNVVLVHCAMGISRSATVVCAYLVATLAMPPHEALEYVMTKRAVVCPNLGFRRQLEIYAARLRGTHGRARKLKKILPVHLLPLAPPRMTPSMSMSTVRTERHHRMWHAETHHLPPPPPVVRRGSMG